tara:strand:- start:9497 stop:9721 length:225 start_codon:yes stop_codon:yes gene_type:complete
MMVRQNLASKEKKPLSNSWIKFPKVILFPLFPCPQSAQNFSRPKKGCPQFKQEESLTGITFLLFLFINLIITDL